MKKMMSVLCILALLSLALGAAGAETIDGPKLEEMFDEESTVVFSSCNHSYRLLSSNPISQGYYPLGNSFHEHRIYYRAVCDLCGSTKTVFQSDGPVAHTMIANGDQHIKGKSLHKYFFKCTKCSYTDSYTIGCACDEDSPSVNSFQPKNDLCGCRLDMDK